MTKQEKLAELQNLEDLASLEQLQSLTKARNNFADFCEYIIKDESTGEKIELSDLQRSWILHIGFCINNNINALILAPMGAGKCVHPDTIFYEQEKGRLRAHEVVAGDRVLSWNVERAEHVWKNVVEVEETPIKECVEIKTETGRRLSCTADHPVLTVQGWKLAGELESSDFVITPMGWKPPEYKAVLDAELAYAYGMFYANGDADEPNNNVIIRGKTSQERLQRSVDKFNLRVDRHKEHFTINATAKSDLSLGTIFAIRDVPLELCLEKDDAILGFLAGAFDATGKYNNTYSTYSFTARNSEFAVAICDLLQRVGIASAVKTRIYEDTKRWIVLVEKQHCRKFYDSLHCEQWKLTQKQPSEGDIPTNVYCERVTAVKSLGSRDTIGVEVEGTHTHLTNGMVSHNTQITSIALPLYLIGRDPSRRIKLVCLSDDSAKERLAAIRTYIQEDAEYKEVFPGVLQDKNSEWTRHRLFVQRKTKAAKDASVDAKGVLSAGIGGRCDFLISDDLGDMRTMISQPSIRQQIVDTYNIVWMTRLQPTGTSIMIATRWHEQDIAGQIMENKEMMGQYGILIQRVREDFKGITLEAHIPDHLQEEYEEAVLKKLEGLDL